MLKNLNSAEQEKSNKDGTHFRAISYKPHGDHNREYRVRKVYKSF
jgi:hypothetical protein